MSIYTDCREAAQMLLDDPDLRITTKGVETVFTELDVIMLAARSHHYGEAEMQQARREASQVLGTLFRTRMAVRYGPVYIPGLPDPDYMRVASKIAYGSPDAAEDVTTPNGTFKAIFIHEDPIGRQGRRLGAVRNDLMPWEHQDELAATLARVAQPDTAARREIDRLRAELAAMTQRAEGAEAELHRLREHGAEVVTKADVEALINLRLGDQAA